MIQTLIFSTLLMLTLSAFAQESSMNFADIQQPNSKTVFTYAKSGETLYCLPRKTIGEESLRGFRVVALASVSSPAIKTSLVCYQCCVGESPHTADSCKTDGFANFGKGKDCGCK